MPPSGSDFAGSGIVNMTKKPDPKTNGFFSGGLPGKLAIMLGLVAFSRLGVYVRLPGVDVERFAEAMQVCAPLLTRGDIAAAVTLSPLRLSPV